MKTIPSLSLRCESSFFILLNIDARYYDPVIGRFYSNDPVGFRDIHSFNRYAYANNNPYKYVDPTGKIGVWIASKLAGKSNKEAAKNIKIATDTKLKIAVVVVKNTSLGHVVDAVSVINQVANGESIADDITGKVVSEVTTSLAKELLDGKLKGLGELVSSVLGGVVGDAVKDDVDKSLKEQEKQEIETTKTNED